MLGLGGYRAQKEGDLDEMGCKLENVFHILHASCYLAQG